MATQLIFRHPRKKVPRPRLCLLAKRLSTVLNFRKVEIRFLFTTSSEIRKIHRRFFNKNSATDVITFADREGIDIVISLDQAESQARPRGLKLSEEATLLMCHGLLHAKGLNDLNEKDRLRMRQKEFECLIKLPF